LAWFCGFFGVDQIEALHPLPHCALPQRCPAAVGVTVHPAASISLRKSLLDFFLWVSRPCHC
jgi:hypothetical protein